MPGYFPPLVEAALFGHGGDGNVTITSGTTTLVRDMCYKNLTISGTGKISTNGYKICVSGNLDLSAAPAGAIFNSGNGVNIQPTSGSASGATGGTTPNEVGGFSCVAGGIALSGRNGGTGAGLAGQQASSSNFNYSFGGRGGAGGAGGSASGGGTAGGAAATNGTFWSKISLSLPMADPTKVFYFNAGTTPNNVVAGTAGCTGGAGAGDGSNAGGGSGASNCTAGMLFICANNVIRGGSTAVGAISAVGGNAGAGGNSAGGNAGGGGGSGGGGGGYVYLLAYTLTGSLATNMIDVSGGAGGNGGNGTGTGAGGVGGSGGNGGGIDLLVINTNTYTHVAADTSATAGGSASGTSGGSGGAGATVRQSV